MYTALRCQSSILPRVFDLYLGLDSYVIILFPCHLALKYRIGIDLECMARVAFVMNRA